MIYPLIAQSLPLSLPPFPSPSIPLLPPLLPSLPLPLSLPPSLPLSTLILYLCVFSDQLLPCIYIYIFTLSSPHMQQGGEITCDTSALANIDPLPCDNSGSRRRRHTVAPTVKQRRRRAREARAARRAGEGGLRCSKRQSEVSSLASLYLPP